MSGCRPEVVAAGPRDQLSGLTENRARPCSSAKRAGLRQCCAAAFGLLPPSSVGGLSCLLLDHEPLLLVHTERKPWDSNPQTRLTRRPVFKTGSSSGRMTSVSCGGRNRTCGPVVQSDGFLPAETTPQCEAGRTTLRAGPGFEPARWCLTGACTAAELRTQIKSALRESNPPCQFGRLEPLPLGQGHLTGGRRGS